MAAEPIMTPMPRRVSEVSAASIPLRHPSPGGTYSRNISRLERSAEEISQGGSDIAEEIRKMNEQSRDRSMSRSASIQSSHQGDLPRPRRVGSGSGRSRNNSNSYANNSIVDVNGNARWGGYSPGAFVTSPTGSVRSGRSWTQTSSVGRVASSAKSSRLAHLVVEPVFEGRPLDSPLAPSSGSVYSQEQQMSRQASQSSFSRRYDAIASQIEESLQTIPPTPSPHREHDAQQGHHHDDVPDRPHSTDTFQEAELAFKDFDGVHFDPDSEEYVEVDQEGHEVRRVSARTSSGSLMDASAIMRTPRQYRPISYAVPPPNESMVYYPAPVPRMLNLPKRLSQQPPPHVQAKRRSQMLNELPAGARESAPWIPPMAFSEDGHPHRSSQDGVRSQRSGSGSAHHPDHPRGMLNERMSMDNAQSLPPQLRASLFFQHQSVQHDVEVKSESAVATLDSILRASVTAPVNAFTDHPYVGDVHKTVYAAERPHQRRSTATTLAPVKNDEKKAVKKRRSSSIGVLFRRKSTDIEGELEEGKKSRPASRGSMLDFNEGGSKLRKRRSQLSLGDELDQGEDIERMPVGETTPQRRRHTGLGLGLVDQAANVSPQEEGVPSGSRPVTAMSKQLTDAEQIDADFRDQQDLELDDIEDDDDPVYAQPTTLLAELQVRKAQLKSRNKTAATAFPDGMHSTLLQLDAVEQINARKRQKQRVALAWEDPQLRALEEAQKDEADEDVPLGMLFPAKDGLLTRKLGDSRDWNRPLGLMERRELEDNEPLSSRRNRLNPNAAQMRKAMTMSNLPLEKSAEAEEDEGETLGQRLRRLKTKDALDGAISDVAPKDGERLESGFATSVLDEFPELNENNNKDKEKRASTESKKEVQAQAGAEEEETLGQRRARLQREREASGENPPGGAAAPLRPALKTSNSLANLLSANPIGQRAAMAKGQAAHGTLLHAADQHQMKQRQDLLARNVRSSSYGFEKPLVDSRPRDTREPTSGLLGEQRTRPANGGFQGSGPGVADPFSNNRGDITGGLLGAQQSRPAVGGFAGGVYNTTAGGAGPNGLPQSGSQPMFSMPGAANNAYFASPTAAVGMGYNGYGNNAGMAYQTPQQQLNPSAYYALSGGHTSMMPGMQGMPSGNPYHSMMGLSNMGGMGGMNGVNGGMPGMGMGTYAYGAQQQMGAIDYANLDSNQRAAIDRWRLGVAQ